MALPAGLTPASFRLEHGCLMENWLRSRSHTAKKFMRLLSVGSEVRNNVLRRARTLTRIPRRWLREVQRIVRSC
jgi:hypothetical protein